MAMIQVVVGLIVNAHQELLITQRPKQKSYSGYWEFPGGKIEAGESPYQALARELKEELDLDLRSALPWKKMIYTYPEKTVELDFWRVREFARSPKGMESQAFQWIALDKLREIHFLPANKVILTELVQDLFSEG